MKFDKIDKNLGSRAPGKMTPRVCFLAALAVITISPVAGLGLLQNSYPHLPPELNRVPDSNQANDINSQRAEKQGLETADAERKRQIDNDTSKLLKLATDLKAEVNKTSKDTLSINVIRKAEQIEKLAHRVEETMKLAEGSSHQ